MDRDKDKSFEDKLDHIQHKARLLTDKPSKAGQLGALLQKQSVSEKTPSSRPVVREGHRYIQRTDTPLEIAELLHLATEQLRAQQSERQFAATLAPVEAKWITRAVQPHFDQVQKQTILATESAYPGTIKALFDTASALVQGEFGDKMRDALTLHLDEETHIDIILRLMLFHSARKEQILEIFDQKQLHELLTLLKELDNSAIEGILLGGEIELSAKEDAALSKMNALLRSIYLKPDVTVSFQHFFHLFVNSCLYPSSLMIQQLLRMNLVDKAIEALSQIKNANEKTKSLELLINHLLSVHDVEKAIALWNQLTNRPERTRLATNIVEALLEQNRQEEAFAFSQSLENSDERENLLRVMAMWFARHHALDQALAVANKIQDPDIHNYAKSNIVHILARQNQFQKAKEIALTIQDRGYREDAILDIVRAYLQIRHVDDAIQFVDSLKSQGEKGKPAKIIAAALKSYHQDEKVRNVRKIFSLLPATIRQVA